MTKATTIIPTETHNLKKSLTFLCSILIGFCATFDYNSKVNEFLRRMI